jgi:hypothetical protein
VAKDKIAAAIIAASAVGSPKPTREAPVLTIQRNTMKNTSPRIIVTIDASKTCTIVDTIPFAFSAIASSLVLLYRSRRNIRIPADSPGFSTKREQSGDISFLGSLKLNYEDVFILARYKN